VKVTFLLLGDDLALLERLDPDADWREFVAGERVWIVQTYLRLRALGHPVALSDTLPREGVVVFSTKQRRLLRPFRTAATLVGVRQDLGPALIADVEVVQNLGQADGRRRHMIPHWPQPGLLPRDPARGPAIRVVAFKGFLGNLAGEYRGARWREFLQREQLEFRADAVEFKERQTDPGALAWNDYREIDVVLAVRPPRADLYPRKPATKLYNAWHAGVPALLGPELAYRELRQGPLDFIEVAEVGDVMQAILQLKQDPDLYQRMVDNGRSRARDFTVASIAGRWSGLLFRTIPALATAPDVARWRNRPLLAKELVRRVTRAWSDKPR
jgi:hypothetical protein